MKIVLLITLALIAYLPVESDGAKFSHLASLRDTTARDEAARDEAARSEFHLYHFSNLQMQHRVRERDGTEALVPRHNEGYAILHVTGNTPGSIVITWARPCPAIAVIGDLNDLRPIDRPLAAIWHDQITHALWLVVARTSRRQSIVEIERLKLKDDPNDREPAVEKRSFFGQVINHQDGEADRIVGVNIIGGPEADSVVVTLTRQESPPQTISLSPPYNTLDAAVVRSDYYRNFQDNEALIRLLGDDAVKRTAAAADTPHDPGD